MVSTPISVEETEHPTLSPKEGEKKGHDDTKLDLFSP